MALCGRTIISPGAWREPRLGLLVRSSQKIGDVENVARSGPKDKQEEI